jgi:uroporphyrinogen-III synthase
VKPVLAGKRIVVTRAREQAGDLIERFSELGADVLLLPAVSFSPAADSKELDRAVAALADFDWVVFTSANAVRFFMRRCKELGCELPAQLAGRHPRYAAVGPATATAAAAEGVRVEIVAQEYSGGALAQEMGAALAGSRVLLPRSQRASPELPAALMARGAKVTEVVAYQTGGMGAPDALAEELFRSGRVDVVAIFSPSALENLRAEFGAETLHRVASNAALAAVGPVTAAAIRDAGLRVAIQAREATGASLVEAVCEYYAVNSFPEARIS